MKMINCLNSLESRKASFLISMRYLHLLSLLPPAEWVTHLQLSSYQLNDDVRRFIADQVNSSKPNGT
jgi:hypothetical protein